MSVAMNEKIDIMLIELQKRADEGKTFDIHQ